jgi:hypothetical protein
MGKKSRPTFKKRQKEMARQQKQQNKVARRRAKSEMKEEKPSKTEGPDPDLEGIRPGPQPLPPEWYIVPDRVPPKDPSENES